MGAVLKRSKREESAEEVLEFLDEQLQQLESAQLRNEERYKRFIGQLMFYSIIIYIVAAIIFYLYYFPTHWQDRVIHSTPLLLFPFLIYGVRKLLQTFFGHRRQKNAAQLDELRDKKLKILEDVKEKETYKKAKEILEKFDPDSSVLKNDVKRDSASRIAVVSTPGTEVRQRNVDMKSTSTPNISLVGQQPAPVTPLRQMASPLRGMSPAMQRQFFINNIPPGTPPGPPRPIPLRPKERTIADKFVDYLVGDGPNNRFALICRQCHSHNGMSLKEDFDFTTFRCCYCYHLNEAKKHRPSPPPLRGFETKEGMHKDAQTKENTISGSQDEDSADNENIEKVTEDETEIVG